MDFGHDCPTYKHDEMPGKDIKGKAQLHLVPKQIIYYIAQVREYGNMKYHSPDNWKTVDVQHYIDAAYRHLLSMVEDPASVDEESGIEHYKHLACNIAFICEFLKKKK